MAKVQIKFQKITSFGGFFFVEDQFQRLVMPHVDEFLGRRSQLVGYQYCEILLTMVGNFFCGGNRTEDINVLKDKMPQHPTFRLCSPDTVLRAMTELAEEDEVYSTAEGKAYSFNIASKLNGLLVYTAFKSGMLSPLPQNGQEVQGLTSFASIRKIVWNIPNYMLTMANVFSLWT